MIFVDMPVWEAGSRLLLAAVLGMFAGFEREFRRKPAGIRTHMLVATGSAAFMILALELAIGPLKTVSETSVDPTRIIQGIIGGIGFLGAGAIIQGGREVSGLTTGASIWVAGAIGISCGIGFYDFAALMTVVVVIIVYVIGCV
jgi:putative Mg2+ transporter-C (MgtC) family protein